jgi:hypothetical protein
MEKIDTLAGKFKKATGALFRRDLGFISGNGFPMPWAYLTAGDVWAVRGCFFPIHE